MNRWSEIHKKPSSVGANRGLSRLVRELKRQEAEFRNESTKPENTQSHRLGQCTCPPATKASVPGQRRRRRAQKP